MRQPQPLPDTRTLCLRCLRPESTCYCGLVPQLESRTRVIFLQHPRERRVAIGTARMAHLALRNSELHHGVEFDGHARLEGLDPERTVLLFPTDDAVDPATLADAPPENLVVVDGTWHQARKLVKSNAVLQRFRRIRFTPRQPSNYRIRAEPADHCTSTIEAVVEVLGELEGGHAQFEPMLKAFVHMVDTQLLKQQTREGPSRHQHHRAARGVKPPPAALRQLAAAAGRTVLVYAEANAHGTGSDIPTELVHLVAQRLATGERFEAVVRPRQPLARSTPLHTELAEADIVGGEDAAEAMRRFRAFLRPDDAWALWTYFAVGLLEREGVAPHEVLPVRGAATLAMKGKAGGVEAAADALAAEGARTPWARGRAGRRLEALDRVVRALVDRGAQPPSPSGRGPG